MKLRKMLAFLLCAAMLLAVVACTAQDPKDPSADTPDNGENTDDPATPDEPDTPDTPDEPDEPDTPDTPDTPDAPDTPDTPDEPVKPEEPAKPEDANLCDVEWTSVTSSVDGYVIDKAAPQTLARGAYTFDRALTVTPAAGDVDASAVEITYAIADGYYTFTSLVGVADSDATTGSVEFSLYVDGELQKQTGVLKAGEYMFLSVSVKGKSTLMLKVSNADGDNTGDVAVWGLPTLCASRRVSVPTAALSAEPTVYLDQADWLSASSHMDAEKGAPFIDKNESGGALSMGNSFFVPQKGVWLHPKYGEDAYAEIVVDLTTLNPTSFVAAFGLSDEYVGAQDGYVGAANPALRSIEFIFLLDDQEVARHEFINSVKIGSVVLDTQGKSKLTIRMTSYDGVHTCDAGVLTGGFVK